MQSTGISLEKKDNNIQTEEHLALAFMVELPLGG